MVRTAAPGHSAVGRVVVFKEVFVRDLFMTEIHYFPRYSQPENFVTNNTLLLLLRLNQYNRLKFQVFMGKLCEDQELQLSTSWLHFRQQRGTGRSVLDGFISQDSLKIAVETKLTDVFDPVQLEVIS